MLGNSQDFSSTALAPFVSQKQNKKEKFIATAGRKTMRYERNYPPVKGELAAVIFVVRKREHMLGFRNFWLITNSSALKRQCSNQGNMALLAQRLGEFSF